RRQHQNVSGRGGRDCRGEVSATRGYCHSRRPRWRHEHDPQSQGRARRDKCQNAVPRGSHALRGSTIIRPYISMCSAWQNHWQYHQCTPGRSAMKVTDAVCCGEISIITPYRTIVKPCVRSSTVSTLVIVTVTSSPSFTVNLSRL